jgi:hypothetical protein
MITTKFCGTHAAASQDSLNLKTLEEAILELRSLPKNDQWLLVDPNGNLHKGDISAVAYVIMRNHPINRLNSDAFLKEIL